MMQNRKAYITDRPEMAEDLAALLGLLHALYWNGWTSHWQSKGPTFLADHDLFSRVYTAYPDEIDALAEKTVGYFGIEAVNVFPHVERFKEWLDSAMETADPFERALEGENSLILFAGTLREKLGDDLGLFPGLDDFLTGLCDAHETSVYLLQQRIGGDQEPVVTIPDVPVEMDLDSEWQSIPEPGDGVPPVLDDSALTDELDSEWQKVGAAVAPSAEGLFFNNPEQREVREFAQTGAPSNNTGIAKASPLETGDVQATPPTPSEILEQPGADQFSTLNRYLIRTEQPTDEKVTQSHDELPKHPDMMQLQASLERDWVKLAAAYPSIITEANWEEFEAGEGIWERDGLKRAWKGYNVSMTYEIYQSPEEDDDEPADPERGFEFKDRNYEYLEDALDSNSNRNWLEWSSSHPSSGDWITSEDSENYRTGERTQYSLFIKRGDKNPLTKLEIDYITEQFRL